MSCVSVELWLYFVNKCSGDIQEPTRVKYTTNTNATTAFSKSTNWYQSVTWTRATANAKHQQLSQHRCIATALNTILDKLNPQLWHDWVECRPRYNFFCPLQDEIFDNVWLSATFKYEMNNYCEQELDYELKEVPVSSRSREDDVEQIHVPDPHELRLGSCS